MKTDSLLYRLFNTAPAILFDLLGQSPQEGYEFRSLEVKQTAHRIDGVFLPPNDRPDLPIYFAEFGSSGFTMLDKHKHLCSHPCEVPTN